MDPSVTVARFVEAIYRVLFRVRVREPIETRGPVPLEIFIGIPDPEEIEGPVLSGSTYERGRHG
jgi:hypothetical protein